MTTLSCFKTITVLKNSPLGVGSFGSVFKARCDSLLAAAKIIHHDLVGLEGQGKLTASAAHRVPANRFLQECNFMSNLRHPNIVLFLGLTQDQDSNLPVLLMELLDENLTSFLRNAQDMPLPLHTQVNICHDIALALSFLHSNGIIHRDLSSNNILMMGDRRAKVGDFGMAKLSDFDGRTRCPGCPLYMPPEAKTEPPTTTEKIDCFSFGVLLVQIMTGEFPDPGETQPVALLMKPFRNEPEIDRRHNHISLVDQKHPLLPLAHDCLKFKHASRPDADAICTRLETTKDESDSSADVTPVKQPPVKRPREDIPSRSHSLEDLNGSECYSRASLKDLSRQISALEDCEKWEEISKDEVDGITKLNRVSDISRSKAIYWRVLSYKTPAPMCRTTDAVVCNNVIYLLHGLTHQLLCSYNPKYHTWNKSYTKCPVERASLGVIKNSVVAIGGVEDSGKHSDKLYNLTDTSWANDYRSMPTKRYDTIVIMSSNFLIVAGGIGKSRAYLRTVEVLDVENKTWSSVSSLPVPCAGLSAQLCGTTIHILSNDTMLTCDAENLVSSYSLPFPPFRKSLWAEVAPPPVLSSSLVSLNGVLYAVGGKFPSGKPTTAVYRYNPRREDWCIVSHLQNARSQCFVAAGGNMMVVLGGVADSGHPMNIVETSNSWHA